MTIRLTAQEIAQKKHFMISSYCRSTNTDAYKIAKKFCEMKKCAAPDAATTKFFSS